MGAVSSSVKDLTLQADLDTVENAADTPAKKEDLEWAYQQAIKTAIAKSNTVKAIVAQEIDRVIIRQFKDAQSTSDPWPFKKGSKPPRVS
jgi:hypothetical protein